MKNIPYSLLKNRDLKASNTIKNKWVKKTFVLNYCFHLLRNFDPIRKGNEFKKKLKNLTRTPDENTIHFFFSINLSFDERHRSRH